MKPTWIGHIGLTNLVVLLAMVVLFGCSSKNLNFEGRTASQQDNIMLKEGGPHEGQWKSGDMIISYTYSNQAGNIQIEGTIELTRRLTNTFQMVTNLSVRANLLDEERIILVSQPILFAGNTPMRNWRFTRELPAAPGAKAMNFSYSGSAAENGPFGGRDQATATFWKEP